MSNTPPGRHRRTDAAPHEPAAFPGGGGTPADVQPGTQIQRTHTATLTVEPPAATTDTHTDSDAGRAESAQDDHGHRHLSLALTLISAAQLMVVLDGTIVNIALPHIKDSLQFTQTNLSWVVNGYTLAFGGLLLLGGRLGDLLGRRRMFTIGVLLFAAASLAGGFAQNETMMLTARVIQGVGAAIASPTALALITTTFPAGPPRNRAFAVYAAMSGVGAAVGLLLGGILTEWDWRWTFFINVPIGLLVAFMAPRFLGESARQSGRFDIPGAVTGTAGLSLIVYGLTHAAQSSWTNLVTLITLGLGVLLLLVFIALERRSKHALLPFRILADRTRGASFVVMLIVGAALFSMFYFLGLYIQQVLGYSPVKAGVAFLPFSFGLVGAAQLASILVNRIDPRWISGVGAVIAGGGMFVFTRLTIDSSYAAGLLPGILLLSFGMGLIFVPLTLTAVAGVGKADSGVGSAVLNTMQQVGGSLGLAALSTVAAKTGSSRGIHLGAALQAKLQAGTITPVQANGIQAQIKLQAQTWGYTHAFLVSTGAILVAAVIIVIVVNIRHQRLAADGADPAAAVAV